MLDVIKDSLLNKYLYIQIIPAIIGLLFITKMDINYKFLVFILWYGVFNEVFALYYGRYIHLENNRIIYNIYNVIYFSFLFWLFYKEVSNLFFKKIIKSIAVVYFLIIVFELFFMQINYETHALVLSYIIGSIGVLICVFYYLLNVLVSNNKERVYFDLMFWIVIAHFFYYLGFTPIKIGENYFAAFKEYYLFELKIAIAIIKSLILSIAFIICSRQKVY